MSQVSFLYLACILAGFALANLPSSALVTAEFSNVSTIIGGLVMIVFAVALIIQGARTIIQR